ncbi:MAG: hypothetical protein FWD57_12380 [Polyangiaceae bacterium]|nr:hypothetical protein [Polyangiaceae bacterium]
MSSPCDGTFLESNRWAIYGTGSWPNEQTDISVDSARGCKTTAGCIPIGMLKNGYGVFYRAMHPYGMLGAYRKNPRCLHGGIELISTPLGAEPKCLCSYS